MIHKPVNVYYLQDQIIAALSEEMDSNKGLLYLSGGTALTRFHLDNTRFSEDLDFFYDVSVQNWHKWLSSLSKHGFHVQVLGALEETGKANTLSAIVSKNQSGIRVDFIEDFFSGMWLPQQIKTQYGGFFIDHIDAIRHKKFYIVESSLRQNMPLRGKDVFDLLCLCYNRWHEIVAYYKKYSELAGFDFYSIREAIIKHTDFQDIYLINQKDFSTSRITKKEINKWQNSFQ